MTERPVAFPVWQEVRTPTEEILLFVILLKIEGKGEKKRKIESSSGARTDFRRSRGPPPSYVTAKACVTGWVTSTVAGGRRRTGADKHTRNPPGTHWRCTDHFALPRCAPPCSRSRQRTVKFCWYAVTVYSISVRNVDGKICAWPLSCCLASDSSHLQELTWFAVLFSALYVHNSANSVDCGWTKDSLALKYLWD